MDLTLIINFQNVVSILQFKSPSTFHFVDDDTCLLNITSTIKEINKSNVWIKILEVVSATFLLESKGEAIVKQEKVIFISMRKLFLSLFLR